MDHLCQFASKSVNNFSKYRVYKSGNRRRNREIDRQVDNIMPPRASTARRCPYDPTVPVQSDGACMTRRCQYGPTVPVRPDGASMARRSQYDLTVPVWPDGPSTTRRCQYSPTVPVWCQYGMVEEKRTMFTCKNYSNFISTIQRPTTSA